MNTTKEPLDSSEISGIWNSYFGESIAVNIYKYFFQKVDDENIYSLIKNFLDISNERINTVTRILKEENLAIPNIFTESDMNFSAPRLFTDNLINHMTKENDALNFF